MVLFQLYLQRLQMFLFYSSWYKFLFGEKQMYLRSRWSYLYNVFGLLTFQVKLNLLNWPLKFFWCWLHLLFQTYFSRISFSLSSTMIKLSYFYFCNHPWSCSSFFFLYIGQCVLPFDLFPSFRFTSQRSCSTFKVVWILRPHSQCSKQGLGISIFNWH